jgi:hypothetical protein
MVKAKESCPTQCLTHQRHLLHTPHLLSELLLYDKRGVQVCLVFSDRGLKLLRRKISFLLEENHSF